MGKKQRAGWLKAGIAKAGLGIKQTTPHKERGGADDAKVPQPAVQKSVAPSKKQALWFHFVPSLVVVGMLAFFKAAWLQETFVGREVEQLAAMLLQFRLAEGDSCEATQVVVVDITSLLQVDNKRKGEERQNITPRTELQRVVSDVAAAGPAAIGIDVYFDLDANGQLSPEDRVFLDYCLTLRSKGIPVFVGIDESIARQPKHWLEYPRFSDLGKSIVIPADDDTPVRQAITKLELILGGEKYTVPSLSQALYEAAKPEKRRQRDGDKTEPQISENCKQTEKQQTLGDRLHAKFPRKFEMEVYKQEENFMDSYRFSIDFGLLKQIMQRKIPAAKVTEHPELLQGKIVLIGRGTSGQAFDMFNVPGRGDPVPGVYVHAAATDTLLDRPLYTLSDKALFLADIFLMPVPLACILVVEKILREPKGVPLQVLLDKLPIVMAAVVVVAGYMLPSFTRIYWPDFLLVAGVTLLHNSIERFCKWAFQS